MAIVTTANTVIETSYIIYKEFEIGQSCTIYGYVTDYENQSVLDKGEQVLKNIQILYNEENVYTPKDGRSRIKQRRPAGSIGGYISHKVFMFKKTTSNNQPRYDIWRIQ